MPPVADLINEIISLNPLTRRRILAGLTQEQRAQLQAQLRWYTANPWLQYEGNPEAFVEDGFQETIWSKQREILRSLVVNKRTAVPACHAPGKTYIAARAVAYWVAVYPPGTSKIITTATTYRQVKNVMWPHIRRLHATHLPSMGYTNTLEWMLSAENIPPFAVAEGMKPPDNDEAALQGTHAPNLLIVVDEAGGIKDTFGRSLEALMTGANTRMLVLGNPPVDKEGTWFERVCSSPEYNTITISAFDTPAFTGEHTGLCHSCPVGVPPHEVVTHLVDEDWVASVEREFGTGSPWYQARVLAEFPRDNTAKTLPISWLELSTQNVLEDYEGRIKLGVDIASDGGDEFVIAKLDGWRATIEHAKAGRDNEDAVRVAGKVLEHIQAAEAVHAERGITQSVRVKVDAIGVGWGVTSLLKQWAREGRCSADIVAVNVSERARDSKKFLNQRAEMWWATRQLIQPTEAGEQILWLDVDIKELAQLNAPMYGTDSTGRIQIEKKDHLKKRGMKSPDRAEAILLAVFEPPENKVGAAPIILEQVNQWGAL